MRPKVTVIGAGNVGLAAEEHGLRARIGQIDGADALALPDVELPPLGAIEVLADIPETATVLNTV